MTSEMYIDGVRHDLRRAMEVALTEDVRDGDVTVDALPLGDVESEGVLLVKEDGVMAGLDLLREMFCVPFALERGLHADSIEMWARDGEFIEAPKAVASVRGMASALLVLERSMLNILCHTCGVATFTRRFVDAVAGTGTVITDTRKTTPGLRSAEKYAVACGGGTNHRFGLFDEAMIKENHLALSGLGIPEAVACIRQQNEVRLTCETENLSEVREALESGADCVLLDNFTLDMIDEAIALRESLGLEQIPFEASGGVRLDTVRSIAETGVERISIGALTHSAPALDLSFKIKRLLR